MAESGVEPKHQVTRVFLWVIGAVVSAAIGVVIGWQLEPLRPISATCDNPIGLRPLKTQVTLSEGLGEFPTAPSGTTFVAANMVDGDATTAWVENRPGQDRGVGGELTFVFDENDDATFGDSVTPTLICITNGFAKRSDLFRTNSSVKQLSVVTAGEHHETTLERKTPDRMLQADSVDFAHIPTTSVSVVILDANEPWTDGTVDEYDLAITDVMFFASSE